jgi:hypothetical protein
MKKSHIPEAREKTQTTPIVRLELLAPFFLLLAITLPFLTFQPFWDGSVDISIIRRALHTQPFSLLNFRVSGHPSIIYLLLLGIPQIFTNSIPLVYLSNMALAMAAISAFYGILRLLTDGKYSRMEMVLATAIFACSPVYVAHIFHVTLDFGVVSFFVIFLYFLLREKFLWASIFALAMCFTKETGTAAYVGTSGIYLLACLLREKGPFRRRMRYLGNKWILFTPLLILLSYYAYLYLTTGGNLYWDPKNHSLSTIVRMAMDFHLLSDRSMHAYLANVFVINFQWIASIFLALLVYSLPGFLRSKHFRARKDYLIMTLATFLLLLYIVTRYRPWNNARYVLLTLPPLLLLSSTSLLILIERKFTRILILSVTLALVVLSNFRTIDPISRKVYGTFDFGDHPMLDVISFYGWTRKDAITYNLEFMNLETLANEAAEDLGWRSSSLVFVGDRGEFWWPFAVQSPKGQIERFSIRLVADQAKMTPEELQKSGKSAFYFLAFPNLHNEENLAYLRNHYPLVTSKEYEHNGYRLTVSTFRNAP